MPVHTPDHHTVDEIVHSDNKLVDQPADTLAESSVVVYIEAWIGSYPAPVESSEPSTDSSLALVGSYGS